MRVPVPRSGGCEAAQWKQRLDELRSGPRQTRNEAAIQEADDKVKDLTKEARELDGKGTTMALWLVRAGAHGEYEKKFLKEGRIYLTWEGLSQRQPKPLLPLSASPRLTLHGAPHQSSRAGHFQWSPSAV